MAENRGKKLRKSGVPKNIKEMSKAQLEAAIRKKRECNAKAQQIVEQMLEEYVEEEWFLKNLKYIGADHFQDIIEERAICKICGYPLCVKELGNIPSQQYRISTKLNKVYDITERKNVCSNQCYKAVKFLKEQLLTSPLWLREKDEDPVFKLLPIHSTGTGVGEEIVFDQVKEDILKDEAAKNKFLSVTEYTKDSIVGLSKSVDKVEKRMKSAAKHHTKPVNLNNIEQVECSNNYSKTESINPDQRSSEESKYNSKIHTRSAGHNERIAEVECSTTSTNTVLGDILIETEQDKDKQRILIEQKTTTDVTSLNITDKIVNTKKVIEKEYGNTYKFHKSNAGSVENCEKCKPKAKCKNFIGKDSKCDLKTVDIPQGINSVIYIEKCLGEWFTIESMCFLLGEEKVKELVCDKGECIKEYYKGANRSSWDPDIQEKYETICKKLNIMEIKEQQLDKEEKERKPVPDYSTLKEESLKLDIKIKAFYEGRAAYEIPTNVKPNVEEYTPSYILPLTDIHAQNALRRRMVLDNLKRVLPDMLRTFGLLSRDISTDVRQLVSTFALAAHNITFRPLEWSLLGLIIIKMLSLKDLRLKMMLESEQGSKYQTMMMMSFQQDGGYLERLMVWITDVDNIMKKK